MDDEANCTELDSEGVELEELDEDCVAWVDEELALNVAVKPPIEFMKPELLQEIDPRDDGSAEESTAELDETERVAEAILEVLADA